MVELRLSVTLIRGGVAWRAGSALACCTCSHNILQALEVYMSLNADARSFAIQEVHNHGAGG